MVKQMKKILSSERGLTLMEIMIGLVIIGIVASMAVPRFGIAMDRMKFRSANRDVISDLRLARSSAVSEKNDFGVYFDNGNKTVTLFEKLGNFNDMYEAGTDRIVKVDTVGNTAGGIIDAIGTSLANSAVVFEPDGSATTGGVLYTITMTEDIVGYSIISILPATGRVSSETYIW